MKCCQHCGRPVPDGTIIGRTTVCEGCGRPLHTCVNCRFYEPGAYHDCREAVEELVEDKIRANFCDLFILSECRTGTKRDAGKNDARAKAEALFNL